MCGSDARLRGEVERMLAVDAHTHALMGRAGTDVATASGAATTACPSCGAPLTPPFKFSRRAARRWGPRHRGAVPRRGTVRGRYRIVRRWGAAAWARSIAPTTSSSGQPVALKFLPRGVRDATRPAARFRNEVRHRAAGLAPQRLPRLRHRRSRTGQLFLSMEYVDGEDLAALLRRIGRLPEDKGARNRAASCARGSRRRTTGVIHRDLKPANIMIDGRGQRRGSWTSAWRRAADELDAKTSAAGTPAYMAPEQLAGREVSTQSDILRAGPGAVRDVHRASASFTAAKLAIDGAAAPARIDAATARRRWFRSSIRESSGPSCAAWRPIRPAARVGAGRVARRCPAAIRWPRRSRPVKRRRRRWWPPPARPRPCGRGWPSAGPTAVASMGIMLWLTPKVHMLGHVAIEQAPEELRVRSA